MNERDYYVSELDEVKLLIEFYQELIKNSQYQEEINIYQLTIKHLLARENVLKAFLDED